MIALQWLWRSICACKEKEKKKLKESSRSPSRAIVERGGEAIFGLYLFLKRKEEGKLEECSKRLRYDTCLSLGMDSPICLL